MDEGRNSYTLITMGYNSFRKAVVQADGPFYAAQVDHFFAQAVELAKEGLFEDAVQVGSDALVLAKYANTGYEVVYLIGLLCQASLDNGRPEVANTFFEAGVHLIEEGEDTNKDTYSKDIDSFLDLKILIDKELEK